MLETVVAMITRVCCKSLSTGGSMSVAFYWHKNYVCKLREMFKISAFHTDVLEVFLPWSLGRHWRWDCLTYKYDRCVAKHRVSEWVVRRFPLCGVSVKIPVTYLLWCGNFRNFCKINKGILMRLRTGSFSVGINVCSPKSRPTKFIERRSVCPLGSQ
jgi:hypothetical protein